MVARKALQRHVALLHPFWLRRRRPWISSLGDLSLLTPVPGCTRAPPAREKTATSDERWQGQCYQERHSAESAEAAEREAIWIWRQRFVLALLPWKSPLIHCNLLPISSPCCDSTSVCEGIYGAAATSRRAQRSASVLGYGHDSRDSIVSHHQARWKLSENSRLASTLSARSATPSD